jgi:hypothetical protein
MRIVTAVLINRVVPGWPDQVIHNSVPLGRAYRVDLDAGCVATLRNLEHPEWGALPVEAVLDVDAGSLLPVCCLWIDAAEPEVRRWVH